MSHESDTRGQGSRRDRRQDSSEPVVHAAIAHLLPHQILELWEQAHGDLEPRWKPEFLDRPAVAELAGMDARAVRWAIARSKKLDDILEGAHRWDTADRSRPGAGAQSAPPGGRDSGRRPRSSPGRSGAVTRYGTGMVRSPFSPEVRIPGGEICPSCGVRCLADGHCGCS